MASYCDVTPQEKEILDLSAKVIALKDSEGFEPAVRELRESLHEYLNRTRDKVADLAFAIASTSESKAAD